VVKMKVELNLVGWLRQNGGFEVCEEGSDRIFHSTTRVEGGCTLVWLRLTDLE